MMDQPIENIYKKREFDKAEQFRAKNAERVIDVDWSSLPFYRRSYFFRVCFALSLLLPIFVIIYFPILMAILKTGSTYTKKNFGDRAVILKDKKFTRVLEWLFCFVVDVILVIVYESQK